METKHVATIGAVAAVLIAGAVLTETQLTDKTATDEKTLSPEKAREVRAVRLSDAGLVYVYAAPDGGVLKLAQSPCAWKPTKSARCYSRDGGDPGVANTMQPGQFSGPECKRKSCVIFAGQPDDDEALPVPPAPKPEAAPKEAAEEVVGP